MEFGVRLRRSLYPLPREEKRVRDVLGLKFMFVSQINKVFRIKTYFYKVKGTCNLKIV